MKFSNQNAALLNYLKNHDYISTFTAYDKLKITSLSKRICELTNLGHKIEKDWLEGTNCYGNHVRVRKYRLK